MRKLIALLIFAPALFGAYSGIRPIVISHSKVTADLTDYPLMVSGKFPFLAATASGGSVTSTSGYDIIFASDSGCTTKLNFERANYDNAAGQVEFYVKVPALSHTTDTTVYMCYGNSSVTTDQQAVTATYDANYIGVVHFGTASSYNSTDSTGSVTLTKTGANFPTAFAGKVGGAALFLNPTGGTSISGTSSGMATSSAKTLEEWVQPTSLNASVYPTGLIGYGKSGGIIYTMYLQGDGTGLDRIPSFAVVNNAGAFLQVTGPPMGIGGWHHLAGVVSSTNLYLYVDGVQYSSTFTGTPAAGDGTNSLFIGQDAYDNNTQSYFNGLIDEVRVSNVARSADWVKAEYANISDPGSFYTIGTPLSNSGNFANVSVLGTTNTQAIIRFAHSSVSACTMAVSRNASMYPVVNDVDTTLFSGSNAVSRDASDLILGTTAQVVVGKRYKAYYATDGNRYSRALKQNATFYYDFECGGDEFEGSFVTHPIAMGNTHLEGIPADDTDHGSPAWPTPIGIQRCNNLDTGCSKARRDAEYIDPQTGVLIKHLVMPVDDTLNETNQKPRDAFNAAPGTNWSIPGGWNGSTTAQATISSSTDKMFVGNWGDYAFQASDVINDKVYRVPGMIQFNITANVGDAACDGTNNAAGCTIKVCATTNQFTCATNAQTYTQVVSNVAKQYTFGSGEMYDVLQQPGKRIWNMLEIGSNSGGVTCDGSNIISKTWNGNNTFPTEKFVAGDTKIFVVPIGFATITAVIDSLHLQLDTACPSSASNTDGSMGPNGQWWIGSSSFGVLVWRGASASDALTLSNPYENDKATDDADPQFNSGFVGSSYVATLGNGDPAGLLQMNEGGYSVDLKTGKVGAFIPQSPTNQLGEGIDIGSRIDNNGYIYGIHSDRSIVRYKYEGDYGTPSTEQTSQGGANTPLWDYNSGSTLPTCGAAITSRCFDPVDSATKGKDIAALLTAFDARFRSDPYSEWHLRWIELGKLYLEAKWWNDGNSASGANNGSPGDHYWGWTIMFDPDATSNVNGTFGAGCVGQNTNPAGSDYLAAGCIVAARPPRHFTTYKGPALMLRPGWNAQQSTIYAFGAGGGPAVANRAGSVSLITCPTNPNNYTACVQFAVDGDPYDHDYGTGSRGWLGTYSTGDMAILAGGTYPGGPVLDNPNYTLLNLVGVSGTTLTFACVNGAGRCPSDADGSVLWMYEGDDMTHYYPWSGALNWIMWNYAADPHGTSTNGDTIVNDYSSAGAHAFVANSLMSEGGTNSTLCLANQGCYNNQNFNALSDSQMVAKLTQKTHDNVTGLVAMSSYFASHQGFNGWCGNENCQTHPDWSRLGSDPVSQYGVDERPFVGINVIPNLGDVTLVNGTQTLYKVTNITWTLHPKIFDTATTSARHVFKNISGVGSSIASDSTGWYQFCQVLHDGECYAGSVAGEVYANLPYRITGGQVAGGLPGACYFPPSGFAGSTSDDWNVNDLCIYDSGMESQAGTRYNTASFDFTGATEQTFGHLFNNGRASIFSAVHAATNIVTGDYPQWYYFPAQFWDGTFMTMLMESPPISIDSAVRTTFQPIMVNITKPANATGYGVEFGYSEYGADGVGGFECSPNRTNDPCVAVAATVDETTPFYWESEAPTPATSGQIAVPAMPEHVIYYRPVYYSGSTIIGRGLMQVMSVR